MSTVARLTPASELIKQGVLTPTGLNMTKLGEITYDRAESLAAFFGTLRDASAWAIGDLLVYAEAVYGVNEMAQIAESTGRAPDQVGRYMRVSGKVDRAQRRRELSWTHHRIVASLVPAEQTHWLDKAVQKRWTSGELQEQLSADSGPRAGNSEQGGGGSGGAVVAMELETAARDLWRTGNPDGNGFILVPVDKWARLGAALGLE